MICIEMRAGWIFAEALVCGLLLASLTPLTALGETYPSPTQYDVESILIEDAWNLFVSIRGFDNNPYTTGFTDSTIQIQWNDSFDNFHRVQLESDVISDTQDDEDLVTVTYMRKDGTGIEEINKTVSTTTFMSRGIYYHLTAFVDVNGTTHVFWERSYVKEGVPEIYWLYHESIDNDGTITASGELIYYEQIGEYNVNRGAYWLIGAVTVGIVVAVIFGLMMLHKRREREAS